MNSEDIKATTTMYEVLARYGMKADRHGMLSCPFHGKDHHASMKIYKDGFHCFACGANGDIFGFVMEYEGVDFKTAYKALGGTYAGESKEERRKASIMVKRRKLQAESAKRKAERIRQERKQLNDDITAYRLLLKTVEPMSDRWCDYMAELCRSLQIMEWNETYGQL